MRKQYILIMALLAGFTPAGLSAQTQQAELRDSENAEADKLISTITEERKEDAAKKINTMQDFRKKQFVNPNADTLSYTYTDFEQEVLEYSLTLKQSVAKQVAMKKAMQVAKTSFLPSVDASGNYSYRINDYEMPFGDFSVPMKHDAYSAGFSVMQPVLAGGSILYNYKGQKIQNEIATQGIELTRDNVILAAENSYWGTAAQKEMYGVMCHYSEIVGLLLKVLQDRYDDGMISKTDLIQMEVRKKEAEMQRLNAYEAYKIAMQNMNVLMGKQPTDSIGVAESIAKSLPTPELASTETVFNFRPDLNISKLNVDYQKNQIRLATAKYNPTLAIGYQGAWGTQMLNVNGDTQFNHSFVVSLKVPLWRWGARCKQYAVQKALYNQAQFAMQDKQDQISKELAAAWTKLEESKKRIDIAAKNCKLADENLELNTFSYSEGRLSILDVLSAQLTWIQAYTNLVQSHYQEKIAHANYKKAAGTRYIK